jgi:hypothetical protein
VLILTRLVSAFRKCSLVPLENVLHRHKVILRLSICINVGWDSAVRESNPGGEEFSTSVQTGPGAHLASCTMGAGSPSREIKQPGHDLDHPPPSSAQMKELSHSSCTPLGLHGLLQGELYHYSAQDTL